MTDEREVLLQIKGAITELPLPMQIETKECYDALVKTVEKYGAAGMMAMALLGAEIAAKQDE